MGKTAKYMAAGLLTGFGKGLEVVAERRYQGEVTAAEDARKRSLMDLARQQGNDDWLNRHKQVRDEGKEDLKEQREHAAGLLAASQERDDTIREENRTNALADAETLAKQGKRTIDTFNDAGDPVTITQDAHGKVIASVPRGLSAAELKARGGGAGDGKYINDANDDAMKQLDEDFKVEAIRAIEADGSDMDKFMIMGALGNPEIDMGKLKAKFPELAAKNTLQKQLTERHVQTGKSPQAAVAAAKLDVEKMDKAAVKKTVIEEGVKISGLPDKEVEKAYNLEPSSQTVGQLLMAIKENPDDPNIAKQLAAIKSVNPALNKLYEEAVIQRKQYDAGKSSTDAPAPAAATPVNQGLINRPLNAPAAASPRQVTDPRSNLSKSMDHTKPRTDFPRPPGMSDVQYEQYLRDMGATTLIAGK